MLEIKALPADVVLRIEGYDRPKTHAPEVEQAIREVWLAEKGRLGDGLFNGPILSLVRIEGRVLVAHPSDYGTYLAQSRRPGLFAALGVRKLAVSGLLRLGTAVVFGRRAPHLAAEPGKWELAPCGGLEPPKLASDDCSSLIKNQLLDELEEELGVPRALVTSVEPFLLLDDTVEHVVDIGAELRLSGARAELDALFAKRASDEYSEIRWVEASDARLFCEDARAKAGLVEASWELLKARGLVR